MKTFTKINMYPETGNFIYFTVLSVNYMTFSTGAAYTWTSPVLPKLTDENSQDNPISRLVTTAEASWISSLVNIGALIGTFGAGFMANRYGKKKALLVSSIPMIASYIMCAYATTVEIYFIARTILGLGVGCTFAVVPNYVGEISDVKNRGLLASCMPLMCVIGMTFNYVVGPFVSIQVLSLINIIPLVMFIITFGFFVPETPYYLKGINDIDGAQRSLKKFRNTKTSEKEIEDELKSITDFIETSRKNNKSFRDIINSKAVVKGLTISCGLMAFQQFSGVTPVLAFTQSIFEACGSSIPSEYCAILMGITQIITRIGTLLLSDRLGRKKLLLISGTGSCLSLATLGTYFYLKHIEFDVSFITWLPVVCLLVFTVAFNLGLGPIPWAMLGELFPSNVKALAGTITTFCCMCVSFLLTMIYPYLIEAIGIGQTFWIFSFSCFVSILFSWWIVPETKGRSFADIQNILSSDNRKADSH